MNALLGDRGRQGSMMQCPVRCRTRRMPHSCATSATGALPPPPSQRARHTAAQPTHAASVPGAARCACGVAALLCPVDQRVKCLPAGPTAECRAADETLPFPPFLRTAPIRTARPNKDVSMPARKQRPPPRAQQAGPRPSPYQWRSWRGQIRILYFVPLGTAVTAARPSCDRLASSQGSAALQARP